ncbi:MAG: tyrosine-type recombinase/integrase [Xenococcus sp. (in: cyanobacteria)]
MTQLAVSIPNRIKALNQPPDDVVNALLASKHKATTRNTYKLNIKYFGHYLLNGEVIKGKRINLSDNEVKAVIGEYLALDKKTAIAYFGEYQSTLIETGYTPNAINVKLASVKALVKYAFKFELCQFNLDDVKGLTPEVYRDTTGTTQENYAKILALPDLSSVMGKRDYAILRLLWDNALRRSEISYLNISDFSEADSTLRIKGKGRLSKEVIYLAPMTVNAIKDWLAVIANPVPNQPLFISLDNHSNGHRLTGKSIYCLLRKYSDRVLDGKVLSPHRVRHSSITAVLDATGGNVRLAQKLSRHKNLDVLSRYDDNREALQKSASHLLASLV